MTHKSRLCLAGIVCIAFLTTACTSPKVEEKDVKTGSLTRTLNMVDKEGRYYGTVELDPVSGGKVTDASGRVIGEIYPPDK